MSIQPKNANRNQQGMASIVVVMMLVIVLSLVSLGLARLVDRATQRATANNSASAANLAAKAGINDTIALLQAVPTTQANACGDLLAAGQPFAGGRSEFGSPDTKYTCILINKTPEELDYQAVPAYKSKIIAISPSAALGKFMFSWQAIDRNLRQPSPAANQPLYDETAWAQKLMPPLLRLSIYQLPVDSKLNNVDANARTYFLYPNKGSGAVTRINYATQATGSLIQSGCGATGTGDFTGSADDDCNVIIDNLKTDQNYQYVIRMTPYYSTSDLKIKANDKDNKAYTFNNTQYVVDVTAKSGAAVKRLRAFVEAPNAPNATNLISPNDDAFPEFGLQSSFAICKRLISDDGLKTTTLDPSSSSNCFLPLVTTPVSLSFTADSYSVPYNGSTILRWSSTDVASCSATGDWSWNNNNISGSQPTGNLTSSKTYKLQCTGPYGTTSLKTVTISVASPPPPPTPTTNWISPGRLGNSHFSQIDDDTDPCGSGRYTAYAWYAADGQLGACHKAQSFKEQAGSWWQVDLGEVLHVDRVVIYYEQSSYLFPFTIVAGTSCGSWTTSKTVSSVSASPVTVSGINADVRCVRINVHSRVNLGEVEIWNR